MQSTDLLKTLTVQELSKILRKSPASIYSDLIRNPDSLPCPIKITGSRRLLWLESDVLDWLKQFYLPNSSQTIQSVISPKKPSQKPKAGRPGRPFNACFRGQE